MARRPPISMEAAGPLTFRDGIGGIAESNPLTVKQNPLTMRRDRPVSKQMGSRSLVSN